MNGAENQKQPPTGGNNLWKQLLALVFGVGLLWLAFRNADLPKLWDCAQKANFFYLGLVFCLAVVSHTLRAWRWIFLLKPLTDKKISLFNSFTAVMYGYVVNLVVPSGGEVVRLVSNSKSENLPWMGVLPTMFIYR